MGCTSCSSSGCAPAGCKSNGSCLTGGCGKLDIHDWFKGITMPPNYKIFEIVEVRFKGSRKEYFNNTNNIYLESGELVAVEGSQGGYDVGHVSLTGELVKLQLKKKNISIGGDKIRKLYRKASEKDVEKWAEAKEQEKETMYKARTIAVALGLSMKLSDVDYQGDKSKATFFYTAEGRVDFRELIKRLADEFKVRIEMRQIGMRQEASRLGGIGACGRELCCSTWLTDFKTVSTSAARYQNLALNTLKLAGQCGKLKCCLNYELDSYMDALKDFPEHLTSLKTEKGVARLQKTDIFKKLMWFSYATEGDWTPLTVLRVKEVSELNKNGIFPTDLADFAVELEEKIVKEEVFDFSNVVGQDSITRMDDKNRNKKKSKNKRRPNQNPNSRPNPNPNSRPNPNPNQ